MTWHLIIFIAAFLTILLPAAEGCADTPADRGVEPGTSYKKPGENNPLYTQRFGADPGVMEYNGRL